MYYYQAYGLGIASELYFPELIKKKSDIDIYFRFGNTNFKPGKKIKECNLRKRIKIRFVSNNIYLLWDDIDVCSIQKGKQIVINPHTGLEENFLRLLILGPGMAILLHQRGRLVLHANAVNIDGFAIGFLGHSGSGKSTTSLALHKKGYNLISDDILSIKSNRDDLPTLFPSFPRMKLWPDVINNVHENPKSVLQTHSNTDKCSYCVSENFSDTPLPLKALYIIEKGNEISVEELSPQKSLMELIESSYCFPMFNDKEISENLKVCGKILNGVQVKSLIVQRSFEKFHRIVEVIENDIL